MHCPACGHVNRDAAKFCGACAAPLVRELTCSTCGSANKPGQTFCDECGASLVPSHKPKAQSQTDPRPLTPDPRSYTPKHLADKILQSKSALEGERKQVTVLFADVKGSMELAEQLDPEEWHRILDRFFAILTDGVHRFEGTVNQYTGDGIMALFGAPIAHEDHAQRACYAALHLIAALREHAREVRRGHGLDLAFRMGLNSGTVVVGKIGDDLRMDYTAQGHCVGLAQRMEALAEADSCFVSESTAALVSGYFQLEELGVFRVKGVAEPVRAYRLAGLGVARTRFDVSRARGLVRFVGRDAEMQTLEAALTRARQRNGQVVGVVADAGTGKSRLCFEFLERCRARGLRVLEGRCVAHGKTLPFLPILEVMRSYYGITEQDDDRSTREKVAGRMLLLDESYRDVLPLIFDFLGVPDPERGAPLLPPEARQRRLFGVLRRLTQSGPQPGQDVGVLLIEDLHWIDAGSEPWLAEWVDAVAGAPSLLLVNFRPEYHAAWMQRAHYQQIALTPLSPAAIRELLADLIGTDASTAGLAARIHTHTAGNPFFAEEVVQSLIESGQLQGTRGAYRLAGAVEHLEVPATVQAVLAARIDRLPERDKRVLQVAAVVGKDFREPLLQAVAEICDEELAAALGALRAAEFVHELALYPVAEYTFKHPLTQAVALGSLLRDRRRTLHAAVARAREAQGGNLEEQAALLAHHWTEAAEPLTAARWHLRAADWIGVKDVHETARHARAAIELLQQREDTSGAPALLAQACARLMNLGWRLGIETEAKDLYERGRRWAAAAEDREAAAWLVGSYAGVRCVAGQLEEAGVLIDEASTLSDNPDLATISHSYKGYVLTHFGRLEEAEQRFLRVIAECEQRPDLGVPFLHASIGGYTRMWLLIPYTRTHRWPDVNAVFEKTLRWVRGRSESEAEVFTVTYFAQALARYAGDVDRAMSLVRRGLKQAEELGNPFAICVARRVLATCLNAAADHRSAVQLCAETLEQARTRRFDLEWESYYLAILAEAHLGCSQAAHALEHAREAVAGAERIKTRLLLPDALHALARVLIATGALEEAPAVLDRMEAEAAAMGAVNLLPIVAWRRADLAGARGDRAERVRLLHEAQRGFAERGADGQARRLAQELAA
jgi:adenylate cyclase